MALKDLTDDDKLVVQTCLDCIAAGDVILHDSEFETIMGIDVEEFLAVCKAWPAVDDSDETVLMAVNNGLNNLLGYPHEAHADWEQRISVSKAEVARVLSCLRGSVPNSYFDRLR